MSQAREAEDDSQDIAAICDQLAERYADRPEGRLFELLGQSVRESRNS